MNWYVGYGFVFRNTLGYGNLWWEMHIGIDIDRLMYNVMCLGLLWYCVHVLFWYVWISLGMLVMIKYI